jgi:hypothetical protein
VSGTFNLWGERNRQEFAKETRVAEEQRDTQRELQVAKGAAREMRAVLRRGRARLTASVQFSAWWGEDELLGTDVPNVEDRKLLASLMTRAQWDAIEDAGEAVLLMDGLRDKSFEMVTSHNRLLLVQGKDLLIPNRWDAVAAAKNVDAPTQVAEFSATVTICARRLDLAIEALSEFDTEDEPPEAPRSDSLAE